MKKYLMRSSIITLLFINIIIGGFSVFFVYAENRHGVFFPRSSVFWTAFFVVLAALVVLHRRENFDKAFKNMFFLLLAGIFAMLLSIVCSAVFYKHLNIPKFYILFSMFMLLYFAARHEGFSIIDFFIKTLSYTTEVFKQGSKSSFAKYLIIEIISYACLIILVHRLAI